MFFRGIILEIHSRLCLLMCFVSGKIDKCDCVCIFKSKAFINPTGHSDGNSVVFSRRVAVLQCYSCFWQLRHLWSIQASRRQRHLFKGVPREWRGMYPAGGANTNCNSPF